MLYFISSFHFSFSFSFLMVIFELSFLKFHLFSVFVLIFSSPEVEIRPLGRYSSLPKVELDLGMLVSKSVTRLSR